MYKAKLEKDIRCPLEHGLDEFGGKWMTRILCALSAAKVLRYSELRQEVSGINDTILSISLRKLVADQLVLRRTYDEIPPRVEYLLTEKGESVIPLLQNICQWAEHYHGGDYPNPLLHCQGCEKKYGFSNL